MRLTDEERKILSYVRHYPSWVNEIVTASDARAIRYDGVKVQSSNNYDSTFELSVRATELTKKVRWVESCLVRVYVTDERVKRMRKAFCYGEVNDKHEYYETRRMFADALLESMEVIYDGNGTDTTDGRDDV